MKEDSFTIRRTGAAAVRRFCLTVAVLSVLLLAACGDEAVRLTRQDDGADPAWMIFQLKNSTGRSILPEHPALYVQNGDEWEAVPYAKSVSRELTADTLKSWDTKTVQIPVREWYGELPEGAYQVRLTYSPVHIFTKETGRHTAVYAFSIPHSGEET